MNWSLKKKVLIPTIALIVLVMGISAGVTYYLSGNALNEEAIAELSMIAKSKTELIDVWIDGAKTIMQLSAVRNIYIAALKNNSEEATGIANAGLAEQVKTLELFSYINIADAQGEVRASSIPESVGKIKVPDRAYFQKAMKGEPNVSSVYVARTTGKPAFAIAVPIKDGDRVLGVIFGVPDLSKFSEKFVEPVKVFKTGYLALFDSAGVTFAHRDKSLIMKLNLNEHDFGREMLKRKQGLFNYEFQGQKQSAYLEPCKHVDWSAVVVAPTSEVLEKANQMTLINLILFIAGLTAIVALLYLIVRSVVGPINRIIAGLSDGAQQVAAASAQVSSSSQQLAEGSSEQAASLEETSSSLEEITSMTKQNADHAQQAKAMMNEAQRIVENVSTNMQNMAAAIADVTKSSEETGKIIKTIDEIAFQTNLLALNAAVEAARAGEAGAGFAVVADEVRNLAMRAAEAAKNTSNLIENTIKSVRHGNELTKLTQDAFKENMEITGKIGSLVDEIAAASQEQTHGIEEINKAVVEMDKVTQQTAANAEESASASEEMNAQAEQLNHFVLELTEVVGGKQNGVAVESRVEPLSKKITGLVHINKKALPAPAGGVAAKTSVTHRGKAVKADQVIPMEEGQFKDF